MKKYVIGDRLKDEWISVLDTEKKKLEFTNHLASAKEIYDEEVARKDLKKRINYLCGELLAECMAASAFTGKDNKQDVENVMLGIMKMQNDWICRLSHVEPGSTKLFFKKLKEDMQKRTDEIIEQIQNL